MAVEKPEIYLRDKYMQKKCPISMYLCLTHKCPNNCVYCSAKNRADDEDLTTDEWIQCY